MRCPLCFAREHLVTEVLLLIQLDKDRIIRGLLATIATAEDREADHAIRQRLLNEANSDRQRLRDALAISHKQLRFALRQLQGHTGDSWQDVLAENPDLLEVGES